MPSRRSIVTLAAAAVVATAGCLGSSDDGDGDGDEDGGATGTGTRARTVTGTTTRTRTRTRTGTPTSTIPEAATVAEYESLSSEQRAAFEAALDGGVRFSDSLPDAEYGLETYQFFEGYDYVRKDGTYFRLELEDPSIVAGGARVAVTGVESPGNASVVDLENVSDAELLREAIETGESQDEPGSRLDRRFDEGDVVEYDGRYYEITTLYHTDYGAAEMSAEEVD
jgi:hypothetical protein